MPIDKSQIFNMLTGFYTSKESFIRSTSHFLVLTLAEKSSFVHRNMHEVLTLCATTIFRFAGAFDSLLSSNIIMSIYGYDVFQQTKRIAMRLEYDSLIIKLMLIILAFSSNCYMVDDDEKLNHDSLLNGTFRLFGSQNVYVEILWRYMIDRYNYYDAALRFDRLIKYVLDLIQILENTHKNNKIHQNFIEKVAILTVQSLPINENEVVPLWDKT